MSRIRALLPSTPEGLAMTLGLVLLSVGCGLVSPPLAFIVPGALLFALPLLPSREGDR